MTEEIIMFNKSDVESLEEAIKRLEQENRELKDKTYFRLKEEYLSELQRLEQENKELKEKIIKLTEENGNLIINRNTVENKLRDTESRLISIQKANTHNLVLLQRRNCALEEIKKYAEERCRQKVLDKINEVLQCE